ncbi:MAG: hypothetical protein AAGK33_13255, partial [Pseudomonadota bacterium]
RVPQARGAKSGASKAEKTKVTAKAAAQSAKDTSLQAAEKVAQKAETVADDAVQHVAQHAKDFADQGKSRTEHMVRAVGRAFEAGSQSLENDGMTGTASYVRAAAHGLNRAAEEVDGVNTQSMTARVEDFVRQRPMLTVGALAIAGFALAGALKNNTHQR